MELLIPVKVVLTAAFIGGGVGAFIFLAVVWRFYVDTDSARHNYMARQIHGLRKRHNDWEDITERDPFPPTRRVPRLAHYLLDKLYGRGRTYDPGR